MLGPHTSFPDSLPEDLTGKLERPEGAGALLPRSTLAAPREDSRVEKVSGVVAHTISIVVQTAGVPSDERWQCTKGQCTKGWKGIPWRTGSQCLLCAGTQQPAEAHSVRRRPRTRCLWLISHPPSKQHLRILR